MTIRVRYAHRAPDRFIEVRFFLIQKVEEEFVAKSGKHKGKKVTRKVRKQRTSDLLPTMSLDDVGEEVAQIVHEEFHRANKAILLRIRERQEKAAQAVPIDLAALQREHDRASAAALDEIRRKAGEQILAASVPLATVQTGETGTTQTIEPVFEVRPTRKVQDLSGPPKPRTEAEELAEGMRLAGLA